MSFITLCVICAMIGYLIGSVNSSILVGKILRQKDIRTQGSGNAGATNVLRFMGRRAAASVLICDMLKGIISVLITWWMKSLFNVETFFDPALIAGIATVVGHLFPIYFKFKGGKGVATSLALGLIIDWRVGLIVLAIAIPIIIFLRMVSLAALMGALSYPILTFLFNRDNPEMIVYSIFICVVLYWTHRTNLKRLLTGTENKISWKGRV